MLFAMILFLMVLSPLFIPIGLTVVDQFGDWRERLAARPVRQFHPAMGLVPAAA